MRREPWVLKDGINRLLNKKQKPHWKKWGYQWYPKLVRKPQKSDSLVIGLQQDQVL